MPGCPVQRDCAPQGEQFTLTARHHDDAGRAISPLRSEHCDGSLPARRCRARRRRDRWRVLVVLWSARPRPRPAACRAAEHAGSAHAGQLGAGQFAPNAGQRPPRHDSTKRLEQDRGGVSAADKHTFSFFRKTRWRWRWARRRFRERDDVLRADAPVGHPRWRF